jgi:hypothetical protein
MKIKNKIGVTTKGTKTIWSNGLNQNSYFFIKLLQKMGYTVDAIAISADPEDMDFVDLKRTVLTRDSIKSYSIIFEVASMLDQTSVEICKKHGVKVVSINYGSFLFYLMEGLLYKGESSTAVHVEGRDVLISPHYNFGKEFLKNVTGQNILTIPYIWEPWFIDGTLIKESKINEKFSKDTNKKNVVSLEPNISIAKTCIVPLIIAEGLEKEDSTKIDSMTLFGSKHLNDRVTFNKFYSNTELYRSGKLVIENRYSIAGLFNTKRIGTIVSNHFYNDLNYVTLEALFLNYPIVHNSEFCKEAGYYYDSFNTKLGVDQLSRAISTDDHLSDQMLKNAKEIIYSFSINNPSTHRAYRELIKNL